MVEGFAEPIYQLDNMVQKEHPILPMPFVPPGSCGNLNIHVRSDVPEAIDKPIVRTLDDLIPGANPRPNT